MEVEETAIECSIGPKKFPKHSKKWRRKWIVEILFSNNYVKRQNLTT